MGRSLTAVQVEELRDRYKAGETMAVRGGCCRTRIGIRPLRSNVRESDGSTAVHAG